jgi:hypothetical protein
VVATVSEFPGLAGRQKLLQAVEELQAELAAGADWENDTITRYLKGFGALLESIENAYLNTGREVPSDPWTVVTDVFRGARNYE